MNQARRVDVHHHFYPPEYLQAMQKAAGGEGAAFPGVREWTTTRTLEELDRNGVETAILSLSPPGCRMGDAAENRRLSRLCNDYGARMSREHPGRFGQFGVLPLPDVEGSLAEIRYAMDELKADGIQLMTSYGDKWLGDPLFDPVLEELNRRSALVFVHPLAPTCCGNLIPWLPAALLEYPHDTNRAIMSLMFSGALSRFANIRFIFCHAGGSMPMFSGRMIHSGSNKKFLEKVPKGIDYELKKLHYDIAMAAFKPSLTALFAMVPHSQVVLGSDFPFSSLEASISGLEAMGLPKEQSDAIYRGNAERLIPRLKTLSRG